MTDIKRDLDVFKKSHQDMIAKSAASWDEYYNSRNVIPIKEYTLEEIRRTIDSGSLDALQRLSLNYYNKDGIYKRIILYYASLLKYCGILIPNPVAGKKLSNNLLNKSYGSAMDYLNKMQIPDLLVRLTLRTLIDGSYYGLLHQVTRDEFSLIDLPSQYCRSRFRDIYGNDLIEFDVRYFYTIHSTEKRAAALESYPKVIRSFFKRYDAGKTDTGWVQIPAEIGVTFSFFDDNRPLFISAIPAIVQYETTVDTELARDLEEIHKILIQKIPHLNDGQLLFEPDEAQVMHEAATGMLAGNKNVSVLTTYGDVEISASRSGMAVSDNPLERMIQHVYAEASVSSQIFSPTSSQSLPTSLENDAALMMILANKYSIFISKILNTLYSSSQITYKYQILPITYYNQTEYVVDSMKLAQTGYSFLLPALAMGIDQQSLISLKELENNYLKLADQLIPLSSSYTQSAKGGEEKKNGAPKKNIEDVADKTIENQDASEKN